MKPYLVGWAGTTTITNISNYLNYLKYLNLWWMGVFLIPGSQEIFICIRSDIYIRISDTVLQPLSLFAPKFPNGLHRFDGVLRAKKTMVHIDCRGARFAPAFADSRAGRHRK